MKNQNPHRITKLVSVVTLLVIAGCSHSAVQQETDDSVSSSSTSAVNKCGEIEIDITRQFCDVRDGHVYPFVKVGSDTWMAENLAYLPAVFPASDSSTKYARYYVYDYAGLDTSAAKAHANYSALGVLYNWKAATEICPTGWHLPSQSEIEALLATVGGHKTAGRYLKAATSWNESAGILSEDTLSFGATSGGCMRQLAFFSQGLGGYLWSTTPVNSNESMRVGFYFDTDSAWVFKNSKYYGFSVRCVQGAPPSSVSMSSSVSSSSAYSSSSRSSSSAKISSSSVASSSSAPNACTNLTWNATSQICDARDGSIYGIVTIGTQTWMKENLRYLPSVSGPTQYSVNVARYYVYGNSSTDTAVAKATANYSQYGVLYNRPAAFLGTFIGVTVPTPLQGVCPTGWHLPSLTEWETLATSLGGMSVAGAKLRSSTGWSSSSNYVAGTDEVGFAGLAGGFYSQKQFWSLGANGGWWSTTEFDQFNTYVPSLYADEEALLPQYVYDDYANSVRCVKN